MRLDPDDYGTAALLVTAHKGRGDLDAASAAAAAASRAVGRRLQLNPDDVRALYWEAGRIQFGDRARGMELLSRARELAPDDFATLYNVACGYANAGELELALDTLERAVGTGRGSRQWMSTTATSTPCAARPGSGRSCRA